MGDSCVTKTCTLCKHNIYMTMKEAAISLFTYIGVSQISHRSSTLLYINEISSFFTTIFSKDLTCYADLKDYHEKQAFHLNYMHERIQQVSQH